MSEKKSTGIRHHEEELERVRQIEVEHAGLDERQLQLERQLEERVRCRHSGTGGSEIADGQQKRGRSSMAAHWEQRDAVPRENIFRAV